MTGNTLFELASWLIAAVAVPMSVQLISSWSPQEPAVAEPRRDAAEREDENHRLTPQRR